ncbi:diaminopimelate decarboxylase [Marinitoga sp. 1135]|uniref:Diaminopimelate decarboxylase n=1 Tax=Marinitoga piezophila (strain DSM 14283 / JCM 11233 / KA3) TaxID=443254 RepID=H2J5N9_MARPK|nr:MULTISPECIES: diaminopimelate decarboxylase [Marinitoga]AEX85025.1 diaminopimelate decarboxylase [Marinitoga piezophila KA3]APT75538.1 diaminopimelate decarboxylase [Marinitoga sp. 1137]NUU95249.1 diaminopimelate decarboxylase [Marinitoga sp. 1135]NUU97182.1 diaminopimelate decarboxylase [Marinitoga sp. 1138]
MKKIPIPEEKIYELSKKYPTPFYIYDEKGIIDSLKSLQNAFNWCNYKEYFAVKATPTPYILRKLKENNCGMDCSSMTELILSERVGAVGENILFTSNNTPMEEYKKALELKAIINFDDINHIQKLKRLYSLPEIGSIRYTPEKAYGTGIIGNPKEAKFGVPYNRLIEGYELLKQEGIKKFGLHAMIISNTLDINIIARNTELIFEAALKISKKLNINFSFIDIGGGFGIPYHPQEKEINLEELSIRIKDLYFEYFIKNNMKPRIFTENGRYITGPHGYLITKVLYIKESYKIYAGVDANMSSLMRPAIYGAYHHISVLGKSKTKKVRKYDVVGSLCENNDKFAINRELPELEEEDILIIHDVGAHGHSMGFNYNGKLRPAEFIYDGKEFKMIRRAETIDDYFSTIQGGDIYV